MSNTFKMSFLLLEWKDRRTFTYSQDAVSETKFTSQPERTEKKKKTDKIRETVFSDKDARQHRTVIHEKEETNEVSAKVTLDDWWELPDCCAGRRKWVSLVVFLGEWWGDTHSKKALEVSLREQISVSLGGIYPKVGEETPKILLLLLIFLPVTHTENTL